MEFLIQVMSRSVLATYQLSSGDTIASLSGAGSVDLNGNQLTVATPESTQATFSGSISGTGSFIKQGSGQLTLAGVNSYTGDTKIEAGTLISNGVSDSSDVEVGSGATYQLSSADTIASLSGAGAVDLNGQQLTVATPESTQASFSGSISGAQSGSQLIKSGAGLLALSGDNPNIGSASIASGTLSIGGNQNFVGDVSIASGAVLEFDTAAANRTYTGVLSGAGDVQKVSANQLTLNGANTYSGETRISGGSLTVNGSLSDSTVVDVQAGTYRLGSNDTIAALNGTGAVDLNGQQLTVATSESTQSVFSGIISGSAAGSGVMKSGLGVLRLSGANTYEGPTIVGGGVLEISSSAALGASGSGNNGTFIDGGGALHLIGSSSNDGFMLSEALELRGSSGEEAKVRLLSGNVTITNPIRLVGQSAIEALSGELLLDDISNSSSSSVIIADGNVCGPSNPCDLRIGGDPSGGGRRR